MIKTTCGYSTSVQSRRLPVLSIALAIWSVPFLSVFAQPPSTPVQEQTVHNTDISTPAVAHHNGTAESTPESRFVSPRQVFAIFVILAVAGGLTVLYVYVWNTQMKKEVEKRTQRLHAEIEERRLAEEALRANLENLMLTLNAIGQGIISTDSVGNVTRMNAPAEKITGWAFNEAKDCPIQDIIRFMDETSRKPVENPVMAVLRGASSPQAGPINIFLARNGQERRIIDLSAPLRDRNGVLTGAVIVFRDITDQYEKEEVLHQSQKMESIGRLAGGVAHDFNNLLSGILGFSEILLSRLPEGDRNKEYVDDIILTAQRAADLTSKLLAFSHKGSVQSTQTDIHALIREVIAILGETIDRRIQIRRDLTAASPSVQGDPSQLQNAILNLALNARDAMPGGGTLTLSTAAVTLDDAFCRNSPFGIKPGPYIEICVGDTGIGMTPEIIDKLFEPFFTTKKSGVGTGLGLSAVYGIVKDHHGAIAIQSAPGRGSLFKLYLPSSSETTAAPSPKRTTQLVHGTGKILLVDDERVIRIVGDQILSDMGYDVVTAENGIEAVKFVEEHPDEIDLVILDVVMPKMNGHDTFLKLRKTQPGIKVLLSSGFAMESEIEELTTKEGLCGFVQKPYHAVVLSQQIAEVMRKKS
jgi:PAS domain S-box-containing protein